MSDETQGSTEPSEVSPTVASKLLCYMVTGIANGVRSVVACYATADSLTREYLYDKTINEVLGALEMSGMNVLALVSDGAGPNGAFYQMLPPLEKTKSGVVFLTRNPYAPERPLYLLSDPPHLLKTSRNSLYNSGRKSKRRQGYIRKMRRNNQDIVWRTVERLYEETKGHSIRKTFKLNAQDVRLTSYSVMKVSSAAHVLSNAVATEVRLRKWKGCEEFAKFCEVNNDIFDMLNGSNTQQAKRDRTALLDAYRSSSDYRFNLLIRAVQLAATGRAKFRFGGSV